MTVEEKLVPEQQLAIINYKGSVDDINILLSQLIDWTDIKKINIAGPPFAIFYNQENSVRSPKDRVYDVGFPVDYKNELKEENMQVVNLIEHKVLSTIHKGSYDDIQDSYQKMIEFSIKNNYDIIGSPKEIYLEFDGEYREENTKIEIQFPIIHMG